MPGFHIKEQLRTSLIKKEQLPHKEEHNTEECFLADVYDLAPPPPPRFPLPPIQTVSSTGDTKEDREKETTC